MSEKKCVRQTSHELAVGKKAKKIYSQLSIVIQFVVSGLMTKIRLRSSGIKRRQLYLSVESQKNKKLDTCLVRSGCNFPNEVSGRSKRQANRETEVSIKARMTLISAR